MCIENNHTMTLFKNFYALNNTQYYSFKNAEVQEGFMNALFTFGSSIMPENHKYQLKEFNIIEDTKNNTIYFFRYTGNMMRIHYDLSDPSRPIIDDIDFENNLRDYGIVSAVKKDNDIYFTGIDYRTGSRDINNYCYHIGKYCELIQNYEIIKNENGLENNNERIYYAKSIETLISDDYENDNNLRLNCIVKLINNKIFFIPTMDDSIGHGDRGDINDILYINGFYYVSDREYTFRLDTNMRTTKVISHNSRNPAKALKNVGNLILFSSFYNVCTDNESIKYYSNFNNVNLGDQNNKINVIHTDSI